MSKALAGELIGKGQCLIQQPVLKIAETQGIEPFVLDHFMKIGKDLCLGFYGHKLCERHFHRTGEQLRTAVKIARKPLERQGIDKRDDRVCHQPQHHEQRQHKTQRETHGQAPITVSSPITSSQVKTTRCCLHVILGSTASAPRRDILNVCAAYPLKSPGMTVTHDRDRGTTCPYPASFCLPVPRKYPLPSRSIWATTTGPDALFNRVQSSFIDIIRIPRR